MQKTAAIIHTTNTTIEPLMQITSRAMHDVCIRNYLDDSLLADINRDGLISPSVRYRFFTLVQCAAIGKPDAMLCACSSVGDLVEELRDIVDMPFLRIDDPMAETAATYAGSVTVCATLQSTLQPTLGLINRKKKELHGTANLNSLLIEDAGTLLRNGDQQGYIALLLSNFKTLAQQNGLVVLAQASMAQATEFLPKADRAKFLTSPESGIKALAALFS